MMVKSMYENTFTFPQFSGCIHANMDKRIILVGGFGDSEYLRESTKKAFFSITITVPDNP